MDEVVFDPVPEVIFQSVLIKELVSGKLSLRIAKYSVSVLWYGYVADLFLCSHHVCDLHLSHLGNSPS